LIVGYSSEIIFSRAAIILILPDKFGLATKYDADHHYANDYSDEQTSVRRQKTWKHVQRLSRSVPDRAFDRAIAGKRWKRR
jgi:hypothetical protein